MGYIVGRNSAPVPQTAATHVKAVRGRRPAGARQPRGAAPAEQNPPAAAVEPPKEDAGSTTASQPQPVTQPAQPVETKTERCPRQPRRHAAQPAPGRPTCKPTRGSTAGGRDGGQRRSRRKDSPACLSPGPRKQARACWLDRYEDLRQTGTDQSGLERPGYSPFVEDRQTLSADLVQHRGATPAPARMGAQERHALRIAAPPEEPSCGV